MSKKVIISIEQGRGRAAQGEKSSRELLILARQIAASVSASPLTPTKRYQLCEQLLEAQTSDERLAALSTELSKLHRSEQHYWIGTFYALLLPAAERRAKATYFTPPHLARAIIELASKNGFDLLNHTAIDPAAGGASFLSTLAAEMRAKGATPASIVRRISGIEIDAGLSRLSETLIAKQLGVSIARKSVVSKGNSLARRELGHFDLVVANPPYGRISLDDAARLQWKQVCHPGHINKYALFTELCFRLAKPGGLVALVLPSSFIAGPLYDKLRTFIRDKSEVLFLGTVTERNDVFIDVAQDVSVILARAGLSHQKQSAVSFGTFSPAFKGRTAALLPDSPAAPWAIPAQAAGLPIGGATLADYGVTVKAGYFVWNREQDRMIDRKRRKRDVPLIWAQNVKAGSLCKPKAKKRGGIDFVRFDEDSPAVVRKPAIVMQRTTNSAQTRRLVAARVSPYVYRKWRGFVSENHTLVIYGADIHTLDALCVLLNSAAVDLRYRQLSGTASVSVNLLRQVDLPSPTALAAALKANADPEKAIEKAYLSSIPQAAATGA